jgi:hypothetical protein
MIAEEGNIKSVRWMKDKINIIIEIQSHRSDINNK